MLWDKMGVEMVASHWNYPGVDLGPDGGSHVCFRQLVPAVAVWVGCVACVATAVARLMSYCIRCVYTSVWGWYNTDGGRETMPRRM